MRQNKIAGLVCTALLGLTAATVTAQDARKAAPAATGKISDGVVKIGMITDMSAIFSDLAGPGSALAARMAIEDFGGKVLGVPIQFEVADHQNKADIAASTAREWLEKGKFDVIVDVPNSAAVLAIVKLAKEFNRISLISTGATARITNEDCTDTNVHWTYDTVALSNVTGKAVVKQGGDSWFILTADYAFGHSLEKDAMTVVNATGGKVLGTIRHPFPGSDFSSFLLKAQASNAKVIALANAGSDTTNAIKQARQFGITPKQSLAALLMFDTDVHSLGLRDAQGLYLTTGFYWDLNDETRKWSKRFFEKHKRMPTMVQAGNYSAITHYLKAIQAAGTDDTAAVMKKMKETPVNDFFAKNGKIRADGRMVHDMYLVQVKKPEESKYPWDYYHVRQVVPGEQAFTPAAESKCPLMKK